MLLTAPPVSLLVASRGVSVIVPPLMALVNSPLVIGLLMVVGSFRLVVLPRSARYRRSSPSGSNSVTIRGGGPGRSGNRGRLQLPSRGRAAPDFTSSFRCSHATRGSGGW